MKLFFILGNQLFPIQHLNSFKDDHIFFMAEDYQLCTYEKHHKLKILLFLSSMRSHADYLKKNKFKVEYTKIDSSDFKKDYLGKAVLLGLMTAGISIVALLLCGLPMIYAAIPINFIPLFFAFNPELTAQEIIKASFKLGTKKWFLAFGLMFISGILAQFVGMMLCFVGIFFTASFSLIPQYFIYKKTIGFEGNLAKETVGGDANENLFLK